MKNEHRINELLIHLTRFIAAITPAAFATKALNQQEPPWGPYAKKRWLGRGPESAAATGSTIRPDRGLFPFPSTVEETFLPWKEYRGKLVISQLIEGSNAQIGRRGRLGWDHGGGHQ